jgi:hypothetical protein
MRTNMQGQSYELFNNMLIAADMIKNVEDRKLVYAVMEAAEKATVNGLNPRRVFTAHSSEFPHIELDMNYRNWMPKEISNTK